MKNFWKKNLTKTLEEYLIECVHEGTDFCFSYKDIPNPDFTKRFRTQYENEFIKLKALSQFDSKSGCQDEIMSDDDTAMLSRATSRSTNLGRQVV